MSKNIWERRYRSHREQDWEKKPSLFAETAVKYFPKSGKVLELGAGTGQDTRFFAENGYEVVSTDISASAIALSKTKIPPTLQDNITLQQVDVTTGLPFPAESFDVVYAHLSLHYFDKETTASTFEEIRRVLKKGGVFAFLVNSTRDPEYESGLEKEPGLLRIGGITKRYFSVETAREFVSGFVIILLDYLGETYKDSAIGVHNLVRFVGVKPAT
jgi:SAM-dependent methyltransferase